LGPDPFLRIRRARAWYPMFDLSVVSVVLFVSFHRHEHEPAIGLASWHPASGAGISGGAKEWGNVHNAGFS